jgi:hypothetical protein
VLFSIIVSTGLGSFLSARFTFSAPVQIVGWLLPLGAYLITLPLWLPYALSAAQAGSLALRAAISVGIIAPAGLLMGFGFPTGMRLVDNVNANATPWLWGINGAAGVLASGLAVVISIGFSIDTTLVLGGLCYVLLAFPAVRLLRFSGTMAA